MPDFLVSPREPTPSSRGSVAQIGNIAAGCILLFFVLPLMVFLAVWIRCDSRGPVFERRVGPDGRWLGLLKFRATPYDGPGWSAHNYRTRAGVFLHYTRLEYLPNLISVARGEIELTELWNHLLAAEISE